MAHLIDPDQVTSWRRAGYQWHEIVDQLQCTIGTLTWLVVYTVEPQSD